MKVAQNLLKIASRIISTQQLSYGRAYPHPQESLFLEGPPKSANHSREYLTNYETCVSTESFIPSSWPALSHERAGILVLCKLSFENDDNYDDDDMI